MLVNEQGINDKNKKGLTRRPFCQQQMLLEYYCCEAIFTEARAGAASSFTFALSEAGAAAGAVEAEPLPEQDLPSVEAFASPAQHAFPSADAFDLSQHALPSAEAFAPSVQAALPSADALDLSQHALPSVEALAPSVQAAFASVVVSVFAFASVVAEPEHCAKETDAPNTIRPKIKRNCFIFLELIGLNIGERYAFHLN